MSHADELADSGVDAHARETESWEAWAWRIMGDLQASIGSCEPCGCIELDRCQEATPLAPVCCRCAGEAGDGLCDECAAVTESTPAGFCPCGDYGCRTAPESP